MNVLFFIQLHDCLYIMHSLKIAAAAADTAFIPLFSRPNKSGPWNPPLEQLPVSSVSTKGLRIDSTKYGCVQRDVQFSTSVVNKLHCTFPWICVDFSWKAVFISCHVMRAKIRVLKCCCLLFDWTEFWESSALLNRESWLAYSDFREKTWLDHGTKFVNHSPSARDLQTFRF